MKYGGDYDIVMTVLGEIFVRELFESLNSSDVLHQISALAVADCDAANALFSRKQSLDDSYSVGDTGGNERARKRSVRFAVYRNTGLFVHTGKTVYILPVADCLFHGNVLCVGQIV